MRATPGKVARQVVPLLVPLLLPVAFFAPYLGGRDVPFGDDILLLNYPLLALLAHAVRAGYLVLWNPYSGGGYGLAPFSALPFYPPTWLLAVLPVTTAMSWTYALDLAIGGLGSFALSAQLGVGRTARLVPAVAFPFGGFVLAHLSTGHFLEVGLVCWLPATLATLHWSAEARTLRAALRRGLLCGGPMGMLVLANGVSWLVFVAYPVALVALALAVRAARTARRAGTGAMIRAVARLMGALAAAGLTAGLLGAVVLLPLRELVGATVRGSAMSYHAATRISEPVLGLAMNLVPGLFGSDASHTYWFPNPDAYFQEVYAYAGLLPLALAIAGSAAGWRRPNVLLYAMLAALSVALALGANTPLYALAFHRVPGLDLARVPARWLLPGVLAAAVLSGVGADTLAGVAGRRTRMQHHRRPLAGWPIRVGRGTAVPAVCHATAVAGGARPQRQGGSLSSRAVLLTLGALAVLLALGLGCVGLAAALPGATRHGATIGPALGRLVVMSCMSLLSVIVAARVPRPAGAVLLVGATLADLWTANGALVRPLNPAPYYRNAAVDLAWRAEGSGRVWALDRSIPLRAGMLDRRTYDVQDVAPLTLSDYWLVTHSGRTPNAMDTGMARAISTHYDRRVAVLLGVSLVIASHPLREHGLVALGRLRVPRWGLLDGDWSHPGPHPGPAYAYRVAAPLPFAAPIYSTRRTHERQALQTVLGRGFNPHRLAVLDGQDAGQGRWHLTTFLLDLWRRALMPPFPCSRPGAGATSQTTPPTAVGWQLTPAAVGMARHQRSPAPAAGSRGSARRQQNRPLSPASCLLPPAGAASAAAGPGITRLEWSENAVMLRGTMRRPGMLLLDQVYDDGWVAMVDGRLVPLRRADYLLTALPVPAGTHTIVLLYAPPAFLGGAMLTILGYSLLGGAVLAGVVPRPYTRIKKYAQTLDTG